MRVKLASDGEYKVLQVAVISGGDDGDLLYHQVMQKDAVVVFCHSRLQAKLPNLTPPSHAG